MNTIESILLLIVFVETFLFTYVAAVHDTESDRINVIIFCCMRARVCYIYIFCINFMQMVGLRYAGTASFDKRR